MLINDIDTLTYNAELLDRHIENSEIITHEEWADNWTNPIVEGQHPKYSLVHCEFEINCKNDDEAQKSISKILELGKVGELTFEDLSLKYKGYIESKSDEKIIQGKYILNITWKCELGYSDEVETVLTDNDTITLPSTAKTPVKLIINPNENIEEIEIKGFGEDITLSNLAEGKEIIIDGELGLVTEEGQNKWLDYDSWGFPKLSPGENKISINPNTNITVIYSPRWL